MNQNTININKALKNKDYNLLFSTMDNFFRIWCFRMKVPRHDVDDFLQEIWLRFLIVIKNNQIKMKGNPQAFLCMVGINIIKQCLRTNHRNFMISLRDE
jgi:DNA-directed RNA polymerase specialized sigma24 family protein